MGLLSLDEPLLTAAQWALRDDPFLPARDKLITEGMEWAVAMNAEQSILHRAIAFSAVYPRDLFQLLHDDPVRDHANCYTCQRPDAPKWDSIEPDEYDSDAFRALCAADDRAVSGV